jgi:Kinesin motor domain.
MLEIYFYVITFFTGNTRNKGIIPRAFEQLLEYKYQCEESFEINISYLEIYQDRIR